MKTKSRRALKEMNDMIAAGFDPKVVQKRLEPEMYTGTEQFTLTLDYKVPQEAALAKELLKLPRGRRAAKVREYVLHGRFGGVVAAPKSSGFALPEEPSHNNERSAQDILSKSDEDAF